MTQEQDPKTPADAETVTETETSTEGTDAAAEKKAPAAEAKPKRAPRRKARTSKAATEKTEEVSAEVPAESTEEAAAEEAKPKRRSRARPKKKAEKAVEADVAAEETKAESEDESGDLIVNEDAAKEDEQAEAKEIVQEIPLDRIDSDALWVVRRLRAKGYEAYLTGGCVRDLILGLEPKDFDVATAATPNEVKQVFRNCRLVGRRFRLAHVYFPGGKIIETATFRANPTELTEGEQEPGEDLLLERDNVFGNVEEDARRRDLTINGLFYDPIEGKIIDYVDGRRDIEDRLIRTIGDPQIRFQEDPVRILRAIKFATRLGFDFEKETFQAMHDHAAGLLRCAAPRLQDELVRLWSSGHAALSMRLCEQIGVLDALLPELREIFEAELPPRTEEVSIYSAVPLAAIQEEEDALKREEALKNGAVEDAEDGVEDASNAESKDAESKDAESKDAESKDAESKDAESKDAESKDAESKDAESKDAESKDSDEEAKADDADKSERSARRPRKRHSQRARKNVRFAKEEAETFEKTFHAKGPEERKARFYSLLDALDQVKVRKVDLNAGVCFGAILLAGYEAVQSSGKDEREWYEEVTGTLTERLRMTRRDKDIADAILKSQRALEPQGRRAAAAKQLVARSWFRDALLLFTISRIAAGLPLTDVHLWKVIAAKNGAKHKQPRPGERRVEPRRSSRRGRGSRSGGNNRRRRKN